MRTLGGIVLSCAALTLAGCAGTPPPAPAAGATSTSEPVERAALPDFSVAELLVELPASVRTDREFELRVGDFEAASDLAGLPMPGSTAEAPSWISAMAGVGKDAAPVFVPLALPLSPSVPADLVEADLQWSVADVDRFASWGTQNALTTVVAGDVDASTLSALPEAGGVHSAGGGADGSDELRNASPVRPTGAPLRMSAEDGWLISSHFTSIVREWRTGGPTLADDPALTAVAESLDQRGVYSALLSVPRGPEDAQITAEQVDSTFAAMGIGADYLPDYDVFGIGWSARAGESALTVVYHDADGRDLGETRDRVEALWTGRIMSSPGYATEVSAYARVAEVSVAGSTVVVQARPAPGTQPGVMAWLADRPSMLFWSRDTVA